MRLDGRDTNELRPVKLTPNFSQFAEGSCLIELGHTMVLCNASVENKVPPHVLSGGWITAEYAMLPRANRERSRRDIAKLKLAPRSAEIQRLVGRSLRGAVNLELLAEYTITVDCDVLQADGGTRTASVTGGFVALALALRKMQREGLIERMPLTTYVSGISAGIVDDQPCLDLCYYEDSRAMVDMNCTMTAEGQLIEVQATGEGRPYTLEEQRQLISLCREGNQTLCEMERKILGELA